MAQKVTPSSSATTRPARLLGWAFVFAVLAFAWLRFSENTADNDLWGHVLYGQRNWTLGHLERIEKLSWTAAGDPWINHETGAELVLGWVHRAAGATGLWVFMMTMAAVTVGWAAREGRGKNALQQWLALALLAASTNFIALGFAVRPQLFTMLALVVLLSSLRRFFSLRSRYGIIPPLLFACWVNFHGGYLAGWLVLVLACALEMIARFWPAPLAALRLSPGAEYSCRPALVVVLLALSTLALAANPWGFHLVGWTIESLRLPRAQITEWQPMLFSGGGILFYSVAALSLLAWVVSRQPRRLWEAATLLLFAIMAALHQRHAPLFGLANLMFTPPHLADVARRLEPSCRNLLAALRQAPLQLTGTLALTAAGLLCLRPSVSAPREHPFAIEVPRDTYPVGAIEFIRARELTGNTITFFDWGQQVLWELPHNPVSFDGRLDTVYQNPIMAAHWRLYAGEAPGPVLDLNRPQVALLPTNSGGVEFLRASGWTVAYRDPLATVQVKSPSLFPKLAGTGLPVLVGPSATQGRARFPDAPPVLGTAAAPR
ncbi:MAG TPA: hypothetical protein VFJ90_01655 [Candidatus Didemnitutus sp.]|nr:hypothetical protein [Candidatus Didemnitutus sp.]